MTPTSIEQRQADLDQLIGRRIWVHETLTSKRMAATIVGAEVACQENFWNECVLIQNPISGDRIWTRWDPKRYKLLTPLEELADCAD